MQEAGEFFISAEAARRAIAELTACKIHPQFAGYLAAVESATLAGAHKGIKVDFKGFFGRYLRVSGSPDKPYLVPFSGGTGKAQLFNPNVAGSYAPSSLRDVAPIRKVIAFHGSGAKTTHDVVADHEHQAKLALAGADFVPVLALATFLLRDHRIQRNSASHLEDVFSQFCSIFGYDLDSDADQARFDQLYVIDHGTFAGTQFFQG